MDITSDAAKIRLAAFQLEGESQVWWDWVKTSRDLEVMTWAEFLGLLMSKYFPATTRHDLGRPLAKIRLAAFQLEGESQVWWDWVKTSRDLEVMIWAEFLGLLMSKYFPATARHAKAQEFLELRQGTMTVMEYMSKFTELTRFGDDYVAIYMAKVRRIENGLKLSIRGKIMGLRLQDMDSMVGTALSIEREMDDAQGIRDASAGGKRKED